MRTMRNAILAGMLLAELVLSGSLGAQSTTGTVEGIDILVKKTPSGRNIVCMVGGNPCNQDEVMQLAKAVHGKGIDVYLDGPDGSLRCTTRSGNPCTDDHVGEVQATARAVSTKGINGG
jgi:hypothetical protein